MNEEGGFCLGRRKGEEGVLVGLAPAANLVAPRRAERRADLAAMAAMFAKIDLRRRRNK